MARHERQPDKADGQTNSVRKPRTFSSTATVETSKPDNSVNITNRNGKPETDASGVSYQTNTKDPFQIAISQGVQDGDTWVHNHVKNLIRRSIIVAVIVVAVCIVVFGVMGVRTSQKMRELNAINDCRDAVAAMNASYSKDFQLKGKIVDAFSSMDSSYDLEKLSTLYQEEVKSPKALDCKADPSGTTSKANTERAAYDKQARTFERALTKNKANQN
ncbi:hydrolase [Bifidobacterium adolescentis]|uniref:hydrolase n=1 Tax=Bifidobacterium adolescentis TaxID=1680 RepID=UPI00189A87AE|nr:hydrolase [Bifidobacterium adolescentis]MDB1547636.1 hydrolase [Bifidobacterium adolescentis]MDB1557122.1 hydrolase [Bifidobacterium adolescentis]